MCFVYFGVQIAIITFIFEIVHVLLILALWIYLTTKIDWHLKNQNKQQEQQQQQFSSILNIDLNLPQGLIIRCPPSI